MGLMAQVINLVLKIFGFAILLALQESTVSGNGIAPSPSQVIFGSVSPTREGILPPAPHGMQLRRDSPSPASQPNVSPLHLAQAPVSTKGLAPLLSPITPTLPPNSSAAPPTNVQNIAPASSPSASHGKTPQMEGTKLVPENPEPVGTPLIKAPHNPPTTQPVLPGSVPSISPQIKAPDNRSPLSEPITPEPAASPPDNLLTDSSPIHPTVPGVPQLNLPVPAASPTSNLPSYSPPLYPLVPEVSPSKLPAPDVTPISTPPPSFNSKGDGMPVAAPLSGMHKQVSPPDSPKEGPGQLFPRGPTNAPRPLSRINSPPHEELHPPTLLPSVPIYKRDHPGNKFTSHAPVSSPVHPPALTDKEHGVAPISARPPSFDRKRNAMPVAAPPNVVPEQLSPLDYSHLEAPMHNSLRPLSVMEFPPHAAPPPGFDQKKDGIKVVVPSNETPKQSLPQHHSPIGAPMQNSHRVFAYTPLPSVIKSPPHKWVQPATPLTSTPYYKHRHAKKSISSSRPSSYLVPSASTNKVIAAPPLDPPEVNSDNRHKSHAPPILNPVASSNSAFTSAERPLSPVSKTQIAPSQQMTIPHSPAQNSPSRTSSISNPKVPHLPHIQALPPPPPNEECASLSCREPFTYNLPGSPCGCVLAMQVGLRLSLALYTFFPLVSELAAEISRGVLMNQSQVLIMGANADSEDQVKTIVLIDLVPLASKFDNSTAYLIYQRFRNKQVAIKPDYFGNYEVLYLRYPGLPASPPARSTFDGEAYSGQMNKGMPLKPLGVDVSRQQHKKGLKGSVIAIIVLLASVSLILCGAVVWVLLFRHRDGNAQPEHTPTTILPSLAKSAGVSPSKIGSGINSISPSYNSDLGPYTGAAKTFSSIDIERATDSFDASNVIGEGGFGLVYSGVLDDGTKVAVKVLKRDNQQGGREFLAEVEMLSRLHHRNLVKLIGICTEEHARCLVYELIPNGSVDSHLHGVDKEDAALDWNARLKIALGAARGLAYLHEDSSPRVIHRDFKSSNILLEHDFTPKVSDFGLARTASEEANKHISTRVMGTFGYVAPEYAMTGHLLVKSDVYSYGVVLLELLTGRKPVDMSRPPGQENLVTWARSLLTSIEGVELMTDQTLGPDFPFDSIAQVAAIASMCVQPEVSDRPFMSEVVQALKLICTEYYVKNNFESRICSQEHIPVDFDEGYSTSSGRIPYHLQTQSSVSDVEWGLQVSEAFSVSARFSTLNSSSFGRQSFRRHSSPGPRRSRRAPPLWTKNGGWSGGSKSEHGVSFRLWPVPH